VLLVLIYGFLKSRLRPPPWPLASRGGQDGVRGSASASSTAPCLIS